MYYRERMKNLGKKPTMQGKDAYLTVVTPHLNRYWHEEGFIPAIDPADRIKEVNDRRKAFIYALGMDQVTRVRVRTKSGRGNVIKWCAQTADGLVNIQVLGQDIGNSFTDLYNSLAYNGRLKKGFLNYASNIAMNRKKKTDPQTLYDNILQDDFVLDLSQVPTGPAYSEEKNIIDIFSDMCNTLDEEDWNGLFTALLLVVWEYCNRLFNGNISNIDSATKRILRKVFNNSAIGEKVSKKKKLDFEEEKVKAQYDRIAGIEYRGQY
jgi:hypothetical protein